MVETERQVEAHLAGHLQRLPAADHRSRAIVDAMKADEGRHADHARFAEGGVTTAFARALADARRGQGDDGHRAPGVNQASTTS